MPCPHTSAPLPDLALALSAGMLLAMAIPAVRAELTTATAYVARVLQPICLSVARDTSHIYRVRYSLYVARGTAYL